MLISDWRLGDPSIYHFSHKTRLVIKSSLSHHPCDILCILSTKDTFHRYIIVAQPEFDHLVDSTTFMHFIYINSTIGEQMHGGGWK